MSLEGDRHPINGVNYHIHDRGQSDRVVLMLHGMPDTSLLWRHQAEALVAAGFRVIVPDMLGYGETGKPQNPERYQGERLIEDLVCMTDRFDLEQLDIVGHDWGAFASWELVFNHPERFRRHVAISVGHLRSLLGDISEDVLKRNWYMYLNAQEEALDLYLHDDCAFFRTYIINGHPDPDEVVSRVGDPTAMRAMLNWDRGNPLASLYHAVLSGAVQHPDCRVPTLGIWSEEDHALWKEQMTGSEKFMAAEWRYEQLPGSHWVMLDHPEKVTALILEWLQ